jgi:hypothetical protein
MDHAEAESADIVSGMATFGTYLIENCIVQGTTAMIAVINEHKPIFTF